MTIKLTINPVDRGTNIITSADLAGGVVFSGTEKGLDGQQIGVELSLGYGNTREEGGVSAAVAENHALEHDLTARRPSKPRPV